MIYSSNNQNSVIYFIFFMFAHFDLGVCHIYEAFRNGSSSASSTGKTLISSHSLIRNLANHHSTYGVLKGILQDLALSFVLVGNL